MGSGDCLEAHGGGPGGEADEFLHVKGGFIKIMIIYILKKYVIFFPKGGGGVSRCWIRLC